MVADLKICFNQRLEISVISVPITPKIPYFYPTIIYNEQNTQNHNRRQQEIDYSRFQGALSIQGFVSHLGLERFSGALCADHYWFVVGDFATCRDIAYTFIGFWTLCGCGN